MKQTNISVKNQIIIPSRYADGIKDAHTLSDYNITNGSYLMLIWRFG
jgi:hypothetical protein